MSEQEQIKKQLAVYTEAQKWIFLEEMQFQITQGMWKGARPIDHDKDWANVAVVVNPKQVGRNFKAIKDNYNLNAQELIDVVGKRIINNVRAHLMFGRSFDRLESSLKEEVEKAEDVYDMRKLRGDIAGLRRSMKAKRPDGEMVEDRKPEKRVVRRVDRQPAEPTPEVPSNPGSHEPKEPEHQESRELELEPMAAGSMADILHAALEERLRTTKLTSKGPVQFTSSGWYQYDRRSRMWVKVFGQLDDGNSNPVGYFTESDFLM